MTTPSAPGVPAVSVREAVEALAAREGEQRLVEACADLLDGGPPEEHAEIAVVLAHHGRSIEQVRASGYRDYWWPTWGARGLLYVWRAEAAPAVVRGVGHEHWRPAEMCLKVAALREVAEVADGAVALTTHELPRVRAVALRTLGKVGDTEHVQAVRHGLDDAGAEVRRAAGLALERMVARLDLPAGDLP